MYQVIRLAFSQLNTFGFEGGVEVSEDFSEKVWEEEQRRTLVESIAITVYQTASAACEIILLDDGDP